MSAKIKTLSFKDADDVLKHIKEKKNGSEYVINLVRADMNNNPTSNFEQRVREIVNEVLSEK